MAEDIRDLLRKHSVAWKEAETQNRDDFEPLPAGNYQWEIGLSEKKPAITRDNDKQVRARILLKTVSGPEGTEGKIRSKSYTIFDDTGAPDERGLGYLKTDLKTLGEDVDAFDLAGVPEALKRIVGIVANGQSKESPTTKGRMNYYINGVAVPKEAGAEY